MIKKLISVLLIAGCSSNQIKQTEQIDAKPIYHGYIYNYQKNNRNPIQVKAPDNKCTLSKPRADVGDSFTYSGRLECTPNWRYLDTKFDFVGTVQWYRNGKPTDRLTGSFMYGDIGSGRHAHYEFEDGVVYDGEMVSGTFWDSGVLSLPKGHPAIVEWEKQQAGVWRGDHYYVYGKWVDGELKEKCTHKAECESMLPQEWLTDSKTNCQVWNRHPTQYQTMSWSGKCRNGKAEGKGVVEWFIQGNPSGSLSGHFHEGKLNGTGTDINQYGTIFKVEYKNGIESGFGILQMDKSDPDFKDVKRDMPGEWQSDKYVVKGLFHSDSEWQMGAFVIKGGLKHDVYFTMSCSGKEDCESARSREQQYFHSKVSGSTTNYSSNHSGEYKIIKQNEDDTEIQCENDKLNVMICEKNGKWSYGCTLGSYHYDSFKEAAERACH